jgi:squalene-associated FAD-dependent desaturase
MKVAVVGAGWAGCAAAVQAVRQGHAVTIYEAARVPGGRARRVDHAGPAGDLDNGQHILIGAYTETLSLMAELGIELDRAFLRMPLILRQPDGSGFALPDLGWLPAPLDVLVGIGSASGWTFGDKFSLIRIALGWQFRGFGCGPEASVADLCHGLSPKVMADLIEPLCVSALNTPAERASGKVFLRVLRDSLFAERGGSNLLLPRIDLSAALPDAALARVNDQGGQVHLAKRVQSILRSGGGWQVDQENFDAVLLACPPAEAIRLVDQVVDSPAEPVAAWLAHARAIRYEAITTVYAWAKGLRLPLPMLALQAEPAQFVFDRGQLGGPAGLLAFVVSASHGDSAQLTSEVLAQGCRQLMVKALSPVKTMVEKRATFACTPGLVRPALQVAPGLLACGDYVEGPYPATLEGAVRSGLQAARLLASQTG